LKIFDKCHFPSKTLARSRYLLGLSRFSCHTPLDSLRPTTFGRLNVLGWRKQRNSRNLIMLLTNHDTAEYASLLNAMHVPEISTAVFGTTFQTKMMVWFFAWGSFITIIKGVTFRLLPPPDFEDKTRYFSL